MKLYRIPALALFFCIFVPTVFSADLGLLLDQTPEAGNSAGDPAFSYTGKLIPWVSAALREDLDFYVSAGLTAKLTDSDWTFFPELIRASLRFRFGGSQLEAGRIHYADPFGFIAAGMFDGLSFETGLGTGIFSLGAYYTGFLYKKTANIAITTKELIDHNSPLDWEDFGGTYFSPRRVLAQVSYTDSLWGRLRLKLALLGQFDVSGEENLYHSQYLAARFSFPWKFFIFEGGGVMELIEAAETEPKTAFAGELGLFLMPPGGITDRIYLGGRWSSGKQENDSVTAFMPLTTVSQGKILKASFSGLASIAAGYNARLHQKLALEVEGRYFLRTDLGTYTVWPVRDPDSYLLGAEVYTQFTYSPVSDLRLNLGGGAFIPAPEHNSDVRWQIQLNALLALF
ncbi:hypothetical protein AGMMS49928_13160 [Spirochaetia bacterium]|nr:hypothetical protein AGMMS49928_13160 [Spirochaetia bacterium]